MSNFPKKTAFILIFLGLLLSAGGCIRGTTARLADTGSDADTASGDTADDSAADTGSDADTASGDTADDSAADTGSDGDTETDMDTDGNVDVDTDTGCPDFSLPSTSQVPTLEEGVEASADAICDASADPVASNLTATVQLIADPNDPKRANGRVNIPADILALTVGDFRIEAVYAYPETLAALTVTDIAKDENGYSFTASWPSDARIQGVTCEFQAKVILTLQCEGDTDTKTVESLTYLYWCEGNNPAEWVSSGGQCTTCEYLCEVAPSPITPDTNAESLPLSEALVVEILEVSVDARTVHLAAEVKGASGTVSYRWIPTDGTVTEGADGRAAWEVPAHTGLHQIQLVVTDTSSAAVASFFYTHRA